MPSVDYFDPRKNTSVALSVNDKVKPSGAYFSKEQPLTQYTIRPITPAESRPGTAPANGRKKDPCSPRFMNERGRWALDNHPNKELHSVTRPLSAVKGLGSTVHMTSTGFGDTGDFGPVVALHSYADSSPVVTTDQVVEKKRLQSAQRKEREMSQEDEKLRVRAEQEARLAAYNKEMHQHQYQQMQQQQEAQQAAQQEAQQFHYSKAAPSAGVSSVLRPGSAGRPLPHKTMSRPHSTSKSRPHSTRPMSVRPPTTSMIQLRNSHIAPHTSNVAPYTHDPAYAATGRFWPPGGASGIAPFRSRPASARPASARDNSFKAYNDAYYHLPKKDMTTQELQKWGGGQFKGSTTSHLGGGMNGQYHSLSCSMDGPMIGSKQNITLHTQNGPKPKWETDPNFAKEPSASGPYASAAENPYWQKPKEQGDEDYLKKEDLMRAIALGKGCGPSGANSKLVGGKWKYIPRPAEGDVIFTDYYGPVGGGKDQAAYYGRAYEMDTAEFAKHRVLEDYPYQKTGASIMGIHKLREKPCLSLDSSIIHGPTEALKSLERPTSAAHLHKINQYHNLRASHPSKFDPRG